MDDNRASRFKLEEELMQVSQTENDIELLIDSVMNEELDVDETANALIGIKMLLQLRFSRAFTTFEELVRNGDLRSPPITKEEL